MNPITKSVVLACTPDRAFALFTQHAGDWWPPDRRHTNDPHSELFLLEDGRFFERSRAGVEVDLGRVREWQPSRRLLLDFHVGTDAAHPTEVEVTFVAEGDGTRVTVTHRATSSSRAMWDARAPRYDRSWDLVLAALASFAGAGPP